jgi:hypothetical protein
VAFGTPQGLAKSVTQSTNSPIARSWLCSILKHLMEVPQLDHRCRAGRSLGRKIYIRIISYYVECRITNGNIGRGVGASLSLVIYFMKT